MRRPLLLSIAEGRGGRANVFDAALDRSLPRTACPPRGAEERRVARSRDSPTTTTSLPLSIARSGPRRTDSSTYDPGRHDVIKCLLQNPKCGEGPTMKKPQTRVHADRAARRHRHHRRPDRPAPARRAGGPRGRPAVAMHQQPQADRHRRPQLRVHVQRAPLRQGGRLRGERAGHAGLRPVVGAEPAPACSSSRATCSTRSTSTCPPRPRAWPATSPFMPPYPEPRTPERDLEPDAGRHVPLPVRRADAAGWPGGTNYLGNQQSWACDLSESNP